MSLNNISPDFSNEIQFHFLKKKMKYTPESICTSPRMDRFIPQRPDLNLAQLKLIHDESHKDTTYNRLLQQSLFSCKLKNHKIFSFGEKPKRRDSRKISREKQSVEYRKVDQLPRYVLDAPGIEDDFYLNILDWSCHNLLCVALQHEVYIRDMQEGDTFKFMETDDTLITCINFSLDGSYLAIATDNCDVQIWDVETERLVRTLRGYLGRVESISWNNEILSVGCRNGCIVNHDVRMANHYISTFKGHRDHVSGLKWNSFGTQLVSGGNDNLLQIWSLHRKEPKLTFRKHRAAIKAVAWCPWKPALLASGGGAEDACIHIWDTETGKCIKSVHSHSQVYFF